MLAGTDAKIKCIIQGEDSKRRKRKGKRRGEGRGGREGILKAFFSIWYSKADYLIIEGSVAQGGKAEEGEREPENCDDGGKREWQ